MSIRHGRVWRGLSRAMAMAVAVIVGALVPAGDAAEPPEPPVLVELFTSQGCSSCPPADALAGELRRRDDVVVLSYHVNYWDYIGWRDPFATEETTARQHLYARALQQRSVYTPQMVIGGVVHEVGSNEAAVKAAIERVAERDLPSPEIRTRLTDPDTLRVEIGGSHFWGEADVLLVTYDRERHTEVRRGENAGRALTNYNVVKEIHKIGSWTGQPTSFDVAWTGSSDLRNDGCAIIVQDSEAGPVLAAHDMVVQ